MGSVWHVDCAGSLTHDHVIADVLKDDAERLQELHHQQRVVLLCERLQKEGEHVVLHKVAADQEEEERPWAQTATDRGLGCLLENSSIVLVAPNEDFRNGPERLDQLLLVAVASALQSGVVAPLGARPEQLCVDVPGSGGVSRVWLPSPQPRSVRACGGSL